MMFGEVEAIPTESILTALKTATTQDIFRKKRPLASYGLNADARNQTNSIASNPPEASRETNYETLYHLRR